MADEKSSGQLNVPRLRVPSHSHTLNDTSYNSLPNVSQRTVSSLTLMLSTPSNNIRRVQEQMNAKGRPLNLSHPKSLRPPEIQVSGVSTATASRKLLNFQELRKALSAARPFVLHKPATMSKYDYSDFAESRDNSGIPPLVKDSQVRAWESAEKISAEILFDDDSTSSETLGTFGEEYGKGFGAPRDEPFEGDDSCDKEEDVPAATSFLESIPNYTKGELKVISQSFDKLRTCTSPPDIYELEDQEKKELWRHRQHQNVAQERAFVANHTLLGKRKVQVFHKKEFLHKLFGYSNNINQECVTNNTSYSACDNSFNAQKAFHEDKEEIFGLLAEEKTFEDELKLAKHIYLTENPAAGNSMGSENKLDQTMENQELLNLTNSWLTSSYDKQSGAYDSEQVSDCEPGDHPEILAYTMGLLKQRVKDAYDDAADIPVH